MRASEKYTSEACDPGFPADGNEGPLVPAREEHRAKEKLDCALDSASVYRNIDSLGGILTRLAGRLGSWQIVPTTCAHHFVVLSSQCGLENDI